MYIYHGRGARAAKYNENLTEKDTTFSEPIQLDGNFTLSEEGEGQKEFHMNRFAAYLFLLLFGALVLFGSLMIAIIPAAQISDGFRAAHYPDHIQTGQTIYFVAWAFIALLVAYYGMYLLIRKAPRSYLAIEYGYANVVKLGVLLQLVIGIVFAFAVLGGETGSVGVKFFAFLLLFGPFLVRKLWLLTRPDRSFDNFLADDQKG